MSASAVSSIAKPQLRGLLHSQIKRNLIIAIGLSIIGGVSMKFLLNDPKINTYAEFYRTYDIEKDFHRIRNLGLFDSCERD